MSSVLERSLDLNSADQIEISVFLFIKLHSSTQVILDMSAYSFTCKKGINYPS